MKVSIIVPIYNVAPYIADCLRSVMRQTYTGSIECLLVDDCGTDDSICIAEQMIVEYDGTIIFRILHHEVNRGLSVARNTGTLQATGDYLFFLDSDDVITDDCIELLMEKVAENTDIEMVQGNAIWHRPGKESLVMIKQIILPLALTNEDVRICRYQYRQLCVNVWNKLLKRDFILRNNILCKEDILFEDNLWSFYLLKYLQKAAFVYDTTYIYNYRRQSITTSADKRTVGYYYGIIYRDILENLTPLYEQKECDYYAREVSEACVKYIKDAPELYSVFILFKEKCKQCGCKTPQLRLSVAMLLGQLSCGWPIWVTLARLKNLLKLVF